MLYKMLEQIAKKYPNRVAIDSNSSRVTYQELGEKVLDCRESLAGIVTGGNHVGVVADQDPEAIILILALASLGIVYIPIDPRFDSSLVERVLTPFTDLVLTGTGISLKVSTRLRVYKINEITSSFVDKGPNKKIKADKSGKAYILHTSGTTGAPKAVLASQEALYKVATRLAERYHISPDSRVLQFSYLGFDSSLIEIWGTLLSGGTLVIAGKSLRSDLYGTLKELLGRGRISNIALPPSVLLHCDPDNFKGLNTLIVVGEACPAPIANKFSKSVAHFINGYGPTEAIICASTYEVRNILNEIVPIGLPLPGVKIKLINSDNGKESEDGEGEMYITSDFLAEGYPLNPELTKRSFIKIDSERFYRTGDIAKILADGNYVFVGRTDNQVKINGQRLELESIESTIEKYTGVERAIVVLTKDEKLAVAYQSMTELTPDEFKEKLSRHLQPYAIPNIYKQYIDLPVDRNGKADRETIKKDFEIRRRQGMEASGEVNGTLNDVVKCWVNVLGSLENITPKSDFFSAGGDSLLALALLAELNKLFNLKMHVTDLFIDDATPDGMAKVIAKKLRQNEN